MNEEKISPAQYLNFFTTLEKKVKISPYALTTEYLPPTNVLPARLKVKPNYIKDIENIITFIGSIHLPVLVDQRMSCLYLDIDQEEFFRFRASALNHRTNFEEEITVKRRFTSSKTVLFNQTGSDISYVDALASSEQRSFRTFMCALTFADLAVSMYDKHIEALKVMGPVDRIIQFMYVLDDFKIEYTYHEDVLKRVGENYLLILLDDGRDYSQLISTEISKSEDPIKLIQNPIDYRGLTDEEKKRILIGYTPVDLLSRVVQEVGLTLSPDENQQKIVESILQGKLKLVDPKDPFLIEGGAVKLKAVSF